MPTAAKTIALQRQFEVGGRRDDHGVIAAQLQNRPAQALRHRQCHCPAHPHRAGGGDQRDVGAAREHLAGFAAADGDLQQRGRGIRAEPGERTRADAINGKRRQRRFLRRLPQHGIAAYERERRIPAPHRHGKVEGGDDAAQPQRVPGLTHGVPRALRGDGQPVELARETDGEITDVDHFLHLAQALLQDLAGFERYEATEVLFLLAQLLAEQAHKLAAPRRRHLTPLSEGLRAGRNHRRQTCR